MFKKWSYCVGVVRVDVTTPSPYGHFFRKDAPLPHNITTFVKLGRFLAHYRKVEWLYCVGGVEQIKGSSGQLASSRLLRQGTSEGSQAPHGNI